MKKIVSLFLAVVLAFTIVTPTVVSAASKKVSKPKISSVSTLSSTSLKVSWKKVSGADGYVIYQKKSDGKYEKIKTITSGKTTSYTKKSLSSATKYTYKIKAYDKVGSKKIYSEYSSTKSAYTEPSKVTLYSLSDVSSSSVKIKWKKVSRADGYVIYQKKGSGSYEKIKTITSGKTTSYTKKSLSSATKYTYKIKAYVKSGSDKIYGDYSSTKSAYTEPSKVTISSLTAVSPTSVKISWKKVSNADGYAIYRKKGDGEYTRIKTITSGSTTSYTNNSLSDSTKYTYKIRAYVKSGSDNVYGSYSTSKSITTPATPAPTPPEEVVNLGALTETSAGEAGPEIVTEIVALTGKSEFEKPTFTRAKHSATGIDYHYYKPSEPAPKEGYPVFLYLHGTNQSGDVFVSVANLWTHNFDILKDAVIIAPVWTGGMDQSSIDGYWSTSDKAVTVVKEIADKKLALGGSMLNIDKNRIYIGGYSAGAIATFREVAKNDGYFAAAVPMAGAVTSNVLNDADLKTTPIWGWHGSNDTTVFYELDVPAVGFATKAIYNRIGSAGMMRFTTVDGGVHSAAPFSASMDRRLWSWLFAQNKATNQSLDYELAPYIKVVDNSGKTVFSELDCSSVAYDAATKKLTMKMTDEGREKLSAAYTASNGKPFTVYYGSKKIVTFTATKALSSSITKFVIKDVFGDSYSDNNLLRRIQRNINKNKLSKTAINETLFGNG
jgi:poly(3-hydroxybutyrate) depolymerase/fibronectin type 3 domain-containing protein